jgi:ectoine hydroxylase-related dioxygenase (phytanoyl-CoA dioxygenase family)
MGVSTNFRSWPRRVADGVAEEVLHSRAGRLVEQSHQVTAHDLDTLAPLRWSDPLVEHVVGSSAIQRIAADVAADDLRWISGYVSVKDPHSAALWGHQDWWCWEHPVTFCAPAPQVALLCYLCDTDPCSGALRLLPGTHLRSVPLHALLAEAHADTETDIDVNHPVMSDLLDQVTFAARAGDAIVIDYRLLHGTHPNAQPTRRDCVILNFAPSWRRLPSDIRAHLVRHPAQPTEDERPSRAMLGLLPTFNGQPQDLPRSRNAPHEFVIR